MIGKPPPRPPGPARKLDLVELRIANLRREIEAETEPRGQAAILYQVAALYEHELDRVPDAMDHYGQSHAAAPGFQPALIAQLRIAERAKNGHNLSALQSEQVATATSAAPEPAPISSTDPPTTPFDRSASTIGPAVESSPLSRKERTLRAAIFSSNTPE